MQEVIKRYSTVTPRNNRIPCPIHNGEHYNLWFDGVKFKCYKCGAKGSVIDFVMYMEKCNCDDACKKLDMMFNLGLYGHHSFKEYRQMERNAHIRKITEKERKYRKKYSDEQYSILCSYSRWLNTQKSTPQIIADLKYLDRIFEQHSFITWDANARVNALLEKHPNRGEYDKRREDRGIISK